MALVERMRTVSGEVMKPASGSLLRRIKKTAARGGPHGTILLFRYTWNVCERIER